LLNGTRQAARDVPGLTNQSERGGETVVVVKAVSVSVATRLAVLAVACRRIVVGEVALRSKNVRIVTFEK
jgi:hypothetical protein